MTDVLLKILCEGSVRQFQRMLCRFFHRDFLMSHYDIKGYCFFLRVTTYMVAIARAIVVTTSMNGYVRRSLRRAS